MNEVSVAKLQIPLRAQYKSTPASAMVTDHAHTLGINASDPLHSQVEPMTDSGVTVPIGVHRGLGGLHDAPTPGDMLCAALAACQDSSIRMVANVLGVELVSLIVQVEADVDLRGTLGIDQQVAVGFQAMRCKIHMQARDGTDPRLLDKLRVAAERSCVVQQTLKNPPPIATTWEA